MVDVDAMTEKALRNIYDSKYSGVFEPSLWQQTVSELNKAVNEEWQATKRFSTDKTIINQVKYQNAVFAAFKATNQTATLEQLKKAASATTFADYKGHTKPITAQYRNWLKTEYGTAKRVMASGKNYARALDDSDLYPNLEYMPSRSVNAREAHKVYYHTILPVTDAWWRDHLAPLDWNCDCWFQQTTKGETKRPKSSVKPSPGLDGNVVLDGQIFSQTHPYFDNISTAMQKQILQRTVAAIADTEITSFTLFEMDKATNGCYFSLDKLAKNERWENIAAADVHMKRGSMVQLFENKNDKSIDSLINGTLNEFKLSKEGSLNSFEKMLQTSFNQLAGYGEKGKVGDITITLKNTNNIGNLINGFNNKYRRSSKKDFVENVHFIVGGKYAGVASLKDVIVGKLPF